MREDPRKSELFQVPPGSLAGDAAEDRAHAEGDDQLLHSPSGQGDRDVLPGLPFRHLFQLLRGRAQQARLCPGHRNCGRSSETDRIGYREDRRAHTGRQPANAERGNSAHVVPRERGKGGKGYSAQGEEATPCLGQASSGPLARVGRGEGDQAA